MSEKAEGEKTLPPYQIADREFRDLVGGLARKEVEYNGEQTRDTLSTLLLKAQVAGRLNPDILQRHNTTLDRELANLAQLASIAAGDNGDGTTATFFSEVAESFRTKESSNLPNLPRTEQIANTKQPTRITVKASGGTINIGRK